MLPIIAGSTAGQGNLHDFYKKGTIYQEQTQSIFSSEVKQFINQSMKNAACNPFARYKIQREYSYPITDLKGQTEFVYTVEMRVFEESDKSSFNGYESGHKFRNRNISIRQNSNVFRLADLSCERTGWQRSKISK